MKTISFLVGLIFCIQSVNSQTLKNDFFVNGIKTFSDFLYEEIKTDLRKDNFDTLCIESWAFVKFTITDKNVSNIRLSRFTPPVLVSSITRALNKWLLDGNRFISLFVTGNLRF